MLHKTSALAWLLALGVAACGGSATPHLIGSYAPGGGDPPAAYYEPVPVPRFAVTYDASLELEVEDIQLALDGAHGIAARHDGYLLTSRTWYEGRLLYGEAAIAVPASRFEAARSALRGLGEVRAESVTGELQPAGFYGGDWEEYSNITVRLRPSSADWGRQVGRVLAGILSFTFWAVVVLVPPALMIVGCVTVIEWVRDRIRRRARREG